MLVRERWALYDHHLLVSYSAAPVRTVAATQRQSIEGRNATPVRYEIATRGSIGVRRNAGSGEKAGWQKANSSGTAFQIDIEFRRIFREVGSGQSRVRHKANL